MIWLFAATAACWLVAWLRICGVCWRVLNRAGADTGRAIAWFCSGGLGLRLAERTLERERQADAMARLMIEAAGWRRERMQRYVAARYAPTGVSQHVTARGWMPRRCGGQCPWCPAGFCANQSAADTQRRLAGR
jgi:hypothetical protein